MSQLLSRTIDVAHHDDVYEFMFDQGITDGLPLVPPTRKRVERMLAGTGRSPSQVIGKIPPNYAPATVEKIAINAVAAGARPEYLPVVIAAVEAAAGGRFPLARHNRQHRRHLADDHRQWTDPRTDRHELGTQRPRARATAPT